MCLENDKQMQKYKKKNLNLKNNYVQINSKMKRKMINKCIYCHLENYKVQ